MNKPMTKGFALWFTGLPCSGKTSLSNAVETELRALLPAVQHLDGDVMRLGISHDLGFTKKDRETNIERASFVASLLTRNGAAVLVSFISPYRQSRAKARTIIDPFIEIYVRCPLEVCEKRDVKGMYRLARQGKIPDFTGVSDPYEEPLSAEIVVDTDKTGVPECVEIILNTLEKRFLIVRNPFTGNEFLTSAFKLARTHHFGQTRKGGAPYLSHPVAVAKMLSAESYPDDVVAAGLLHDVLEDTGCEYEEIRRTAGDAVALLVAQVTDKDKTVPWSKRKQAYLKQLESATPEALALSAADKIHNIESMVQGYREAGEAFFRSLSGGFDEKLDNYRRIFETVQARIPSCRLLSRFQAALHSLQELRRQSLVAR